MKILCFGDSLTSGYPNYTPEFIRASFMDKGDPTTSYPYMLEQYLKSKLNSIEVLNRGVPGNTVQHLFNRVDDHVFSEIPNTVIIMIGSNDLLRSKSIGKITTRIIELHQLIRSKDIVTIGATVPPISISHLPIVELNNLLSYNFEKYGIDWCDIFEKLSDQNYRLPQQFDHGDGIHLTKLANEKIAKIFSEYIT